MNISSTFSDIMHASRDALRKNRIVREVNNHKILIGSLVLTILIAPKAKHGLNTYLKNSHAQEVQQIEKNMERRIYNIKQERKIQKKKDEIREYDRLLKVLQKAISYSHKTLRKKDITFAESQEIRNNVLEESIRLIPLIKENRKIAVQELEELIRS